MSTYSLRGLYSKFLRETTLTIGRFETPPPNAAAVVAVEHIHRDCREMCVLRLHDAWARFCRELVILSAGCRPITLNGARIPFAPHISGRNDVLPRLRSLYPRTRGNWEPRWYIANECVNAAQRLNISNFVAVSTGIGLTPSPADHLRCMRNFLAHRGERTAIDVRRIAQSLGSHQGTKVDVILSQPTHPGMTVFEKWARDLQNMARIAAS